MSRQSEKSALAKLQASEFKGFVISILKSHLENTSVFQVHCQTASRVSCNLRVKSNTCYCCDLYNCGKYVCVSESYLDTFLLGYLLQTIDLRRKKMTINMLSFVLPRFWFIFACMVCAFIPENQLCSKERLCLFMFQRTSSYGTSE